MENALQVAVASDRSLAPKKARTKLSEAEAAAIITFRKAAQPPPGRVKIVSFQKVRTT
ncbi:MAG: hypothetical protein ABW189_06015 [Rickettsiales bacterium]